MNRVKLNKHRQKGLSGPTWLVVIAIFSFLMLTFFKVFPMYYKSFQVQAVLKSVQEDAGLDVKSKRAIWESMKKKLFVNEVHTLIARENVKMSRKDGKTTITVTYETRDDYIGNLFIGGKFVETVVIDR
ncbi:MAG: DUF4845 domain-containing protein [Gammaproteobacteria bacterium]|nr:DUF4845 domain-containing protein [Gammaproteobacteria bacterium]